jgi:DNA-binding beta-propeller fold protein YncE
LSAKLPVGAADIGAAVVGTKIYLVGGYGDRYMNSIYVFDTQTDTISALSTKLPVAATRIGAAAIGTKIYLFGGCYGNTSDYGDYVKTIWVFDTETNLISTLDATLPKARPYHAAAVGTKIYLFEEPILDESTIRVFDVESNTISELDITARSPDAIDVVGTKIYILSRAAEIQVFDIESGTISVLDVKMPSYRYNVGAAIAGTKLYRFGGYRNGVRSDIDMFDTETVIYLDAGDLLVEIQEGNEFQLLPNIEIGIANVYLGNSEGYAEKVPSYLYKDGAWVEI